MVTDTEKIFEQKAHDVINSHANMLGVAPEQLYEWGLPVSFIEDLFRRAWAAYQAGFHYCAQCYGAEHECYSADATLDDFCLDVCDPDRMWRLRMLTRSNVWVICCKAHSARAKARG